MGIGRYYASFADLIPATLLGRIERELGPDAFRQMWKSDAPLAVSFAQARNMALGDWIHEYITTRALPYRSGPMLTLPTWLVIGIVIPGLVALGAYGASRRTGIA